MEGSSGAATARRGDARGCTDAKVERARASLNVELRTKHALEVRLNSGQTLASLDDLHFSSLNFLTTLRRSIKSIWSSKSILNMM